MRIVSTHRAALVAGLLALAAPAAAVAGGYYDAGWGGYADHDDGGNRFGQGTALVGTGFGESDGAEFVTGGIGYAAPEAGLGLPTGYAYGPALAPRTDLVPQTVYRPVTRHYTVPVQGYRTVRRVHLVPVATYHHVPVTTFQTYSRTVEVPRTVYRPIHRVCDCGW